MKHKAAILFLLFLCIGCSDTGKKNLKNLKLVKIGMTRLEVRDAMGVPKDSSMRYDLTYRYESPFGYSDDIRIVFDTMEYRVRLINEGH